MTMLAASPPLVCPREPDDVDGGSQLAETWRGGRQVAGPAPKLGISTGAPTFSAIANMKETTRLGLPAFPRTLHHLMPDPSITRKLETDGIMMASLPITVVIDVLVAACMFAAAPDVAKVGIFRRLSMSGED
jgi:hypothetical protein